MLNDCGLAKSSNFEDDDDSIIRFSPYKEEKLKELLSAIPHEFRPKFNDQWFRLFVKEEIELSHKNHSKTITPMSSKSELRNLELAISNVDSLLLTGDHIKGIGDVPVEVTLIDSRTKEVVKSGPEASGKVEIIAFEAEADDRRNDLKNILILHNGANRPARLDKICLKLIEGTAVLPIVSFVREKKWTKISKLRLQASFMDDFKGIQVKEARTEPLILKDRRIQASNKHEIPSLDDDVWRLNKVSKTGLLAKSLKEAGIKTVRDFIDQLIVNPQCLDEIFEGANHAKSLKFTKAHARKCPAKFKYHSSSSDQKTEVVFNVSGDVLGLYLKDQLISADILSETQKDVAENLVISAFRNWGDVILVNEDQFVSCYSPHLLNNRSSSNPVDHAPAKTEVVTPSHGSIILEGHDLEINEVSLIGSMFPDGQYPNLQFLPEPLRTLHNKIYSDFESLCTSNQPQLEPGSKWVGTETSQKNRFCKIRRMLFCVVTFTKVLGDSHAHKKRRLS